MADDDAWRAAMNDMSADVARDVLRTFDVAELPLDAAELSMRLTELVAAARALRRALLREWSAADVALARAAEARVDAYWWRRWLALSTLILPGEPEDAALVGTLSMQVWQALAYLVLIRVYPDDRTVAAYVADEQQAHAEWLAVAGDLIAYEDHVWRPPAPVGMQPADMQHLYLLLGHNWRHYTYADAPHLWALLRRVRERALLMAVLDSDGFLGTPPVDVDDVVLNEIRAYAFGYQLWVISNLRTASFAETLAVAPGLSTCLAQIEHMTSERLAGMFDGVRPTINAEMRLAWIIPGTRETWARERRCAAADIDETALLQLDQDRYMRFLNMIGADGAMQALVRSDEPNTRNVARIITMVDHIANTYGWPDFGDHVVSERYVGGEYLLVRLRTTPHMILQLFNAYAVVAGGALYAVPTAEAALALFFWLTRTSAYAHAFPLLYHQIARPLAPPARARKLVVDEYDD